MTPPKSQHAQYDFVAREYCWPVTVWALWLPSSSTLKCCQLRGASGARSSFGLGLQGCRNFEQQTAPNLPPPARNPHPSIHSSTRFPQTANFVNSSPPPRNATTPTFNIFHIHQTYQDIIVKHPIFISSAYQRAAQTFAVSSAQQEPAAQGCSGLLLAFNWSDRSVRRPPR